MKKKEKKNVLNFKTNSFIEIEIDKCDIKEYEDEISNYNIDIPTRLLIQDVIDMNNIKIKKQKIIIISFQKNKIRIVFDENEIRISEISCKNEDDFIDETYLKINDTLNVTKYLYDSHLDVVMCKTYPNNNPSTQNWELEKNEAINLTKSLIYFISHILNVDEIMDFNKVLQTLDQLENGKQKQFSIPNI